MCALYVCLICVAYVSWTLTGQDQDRRWEAGSTGVQKSCQTCATRGGSSRPWPSCAASTGSIVSAPLLPVPHCFLSRAALYPPLAATPRCPLHPSAPRPATPRVPAVCALAYRGNSVPAFFCVFCFFFPLARLGAYLHAGRLACTLLASTRAAQGPCMSRRLHLARASCCV